MYTCRQSGVGGVETHGDGEVSDVKTRDGETLLSEYSVWRTHDGFLLYTDRDKGHTLLESGRPGKPHVFLRLQLVADLDKLQASAELHAVRCKNPQDREMPQTVLFSPGVIDHPLVLAARQAPTAVTVWRLRRQGLLTDMRGVAYEYPHFWPGMRAIHQLTFSREGMPRLDEQELDGMEKTDLLEFACEQVYVLRFFRARDGSVVLRGNGDDEDRLVIHDPPDQVCVVLEVDTEQLRAKVYRVEGFASRDTLPPGGTASSPPRRHPAPHSGSSGTDGARSGRWTVSLRSRHRAGARMYLVAGEGSTRVELLLFDN